MRFLVLLMALAACTAPAPRDPTGLRDRAAPVASQLDATEARLAGDWVVVQGAGIAPGARVRIGPGRMRIEHGRGVSATSLDSLGQGRFRTDDGPLWVFWIDTADRTAALGDPGGSRVWIMDRTPASSPDRITAAREILGWYGYDLTRLLPR